MVKTRTRVHDDGRTEIERVLSADAMDSWTNDDPLAYERSVVWLEDIGPLPYVREGFVNQAASRRGPLYWKGTGRIVGYARLTHDAPKTPEGGYRRRIFYLRGNDPVEGPDAWPASAVDPRTVLPGISGRRDAESA